MKYSAAERKLTGLVLAAFPLGLAKNPPSVGTEEWTEIARLADRHGLLPLLHASLGKLGMLNQLPVQDREFLHSAYWRSAVGNRLVLEELRHLLNLFEQDGIPVIVLKGCALASWLYPIEGWRPFSDVDLLVQQRDKERARALVLANGWEHDVSELDFRQPFLGQESYKMRAGLPIHLEVHWHILDLPYYNQKISMEWFWEWTMLLGIQGQQAVVFSPTAQLLHLCAHLGIHHLRSRFIWSYDLALLLVRCGEQIDWPKLAEAMQRFGLTQVVRECLRDVWDIWKVQIPSGAQESLQHTTPSLAERLSTRAMKARQVAAGPAWDGLFAPELQGNRSYWRRVLFPSKDLIRARYRVSNTFLPLLYPWYLVSGLGKFVRSIASVLVRTRRPA